MRKWKWKMKDQNFHRISNQMRKTYLKSKLIINKKSKSKLFRRSQIQYLPMVYLWNNGEIHTKGRKLVCQRLDKYGSSWIKHKKKNTKRNLGNKNKDTNNTKLWCFPLIQTLQRRTKNRQKIIFFPSTESKQSWSKIMRLLLQQKMCPQWLNAQNISDSTYYNKLKS